MQIIKGNLIDLAVDGTAGIIVHGCNCFHAMGSGIAGALAERFPEIAYADRIYKGKGDPSKLGHYSKANVNNERNYKGGVEYPLVNSFQCINMYTQYKPGSDFIPSLFPFALKRLNEDFKGQHLWFPMIGCGIGGGDWTQVMDDMLTNLTDVDVTVVVL